MNFVAYLLNACVGISRASLLFATDARDEEEIARKNEAAFMGDSDGVEESQFKKEGVRLRTIDNF